MNMCFPVQYLELSVLWVSLMFMICGQVVFLYYIHIFYMCKNKCLWRIHKIKFKYLAKSSEDISRSNIVLVIKAKVTIYLFYLYRKIP